MKTSARFQPYCRKYYIKIGCFKGKEINPRNITEKNTSFFTDENHFCLLWKSKSNNFFKAIKQLKLTSKLLIKLYLINMLKFW